MRMEHFSFVSVEVLITAYSILSVGRLYLCNDEK